MTELRVNITRASHAGADLLLRRLFGMGGHERIIRKQPWYVVALPDEQAEGFAGLLKARGVPASAVTLTKER